MKKILIVTEIFYPENGLINDFSEELVRRGFDVEVLTQHPSYPLGKLFQGYENEDYKVDNWNSIKIHRFKVVEGYCQSKVKKVLNYWEFVKQGGQIAKKIGGKYDHILVYQTGPLTLALPAVEIKKRFKIPLTVWTFDIWPDAVYAYGFPKVFPLTTFLRGIVKKVYSNADNILVSSKAFASTINQYVTDKQVDYAPNWLIQEDQQESTFKLSAEKFNFTFTGNVSKVQNLENVLKGWKMARVEQKAVLNIVGDGSVLGSLREFVERNSVEGVVFYGRHPSSQMQSIMEQSDMLVLPLVEDSGISKTEPYKLQSYLKSGKPIYGVVEGVAREIVEQNGLGICAKPNCVESISKGFIDSMTFAHSDAAKMVVERSKELLENRYNREKIIDKVIRILVDR